MQAHPHKLQDPAFAFAVALFLEVLIAAVLGAALVAVLNLAAEEKAVAPAHADRAHRVGSHRAQNLYVRTTTAS